ncbi:MAG: hypothetical protein ACR2LI_18025 [Propionibacteriaceae bacterium]
MSDNVPRPLSPQECWSRLGRHGEGRLGYLSGRGPRHVVVPYAVSGKRLVVRLPDYNEAARYAPGNRVTFDVTDRLGDHVAERIEITGCAHSGEKPEGGELDDLPDEHWPADLRSLLVWLPMDDVRGEIVVAVPADGGAR